MRRISPILTAVTAAALLSVAACTSADGVAGDDTRDGTAYTYDSDRDDAERIEGVQLAEKMGPVEPSEKYRVAVVLKALTNQYWQGIQKGAEAAAKDLGVEVTVQAASSETAQTEQLTIAQTLVGQRFDAYVVAPESTSNLNPALAQMRKQNAPVVNVDDARVKATTFVGPDHELDGEQAAEEFAKLLPGGGKVAQIEGQAGSSAAVLRIKGFKKGLAKHPELKLVTSVPGDWDADKSYAATQTIIRHHPDVKAIYANNDTMAIGVAKAVKQSGKNIAVIGTDGVPEAVSGVRSGNLTATVSPLPYYEGYWAVESAVRLLEGQKVPAWVMAPAQMITKDTVDAYYDGEGQVRTDIYE